VFDGMRNPNKKVIDDKRAKDVNEDYTTFRTIIRERHVNEFFKVSGLMKKSIYTREDMIESAKKFADENDIKCICAPFEADHQLVMLEKQGIIDGAITQDSDVIALGCPLVITKINKKNGNCSVVDRARISNAFLEKYDNNRDTFLAYMCFLGNDYIGAIQRNTIKEAFLERWQNATEEEKQGILQQFENDTNYRLEN